MYFVRVYEKEKKKIEETAARTSEENFAPVVARAIGRNAPTKLLDRLFGESSENVARGRDSITHYLYLALFFHLRLLSIYSLFLYI